MKRKLVSMFVIALLASSMSFAVLVDDFDSYITGQIDGVTGGAWVSTKISANPTTLPISTMVIATDPTDAGSRVLSARPTGGQCGLYGVLTGSEIVADNTTRTMSLRFRLTTATSDASFGLTTLDAPNEFGNTFNAQCALINGTFKARNGGATSASLATIAVDTWYYIWVVVNNTANTYDIYLKTTASNATTTDLIADDYAFRTGTPDGNLDRFFVMMQNTNVDILFDNINMRDGVDLTIPPMLKPYGPSVEQAPNGSVVDITLKWKAGVDPASVYAVNPDIINQYIFAGSGTDPNLYYKGATGVDPGTTNPDSQYLMTGAYDTTYRWVVVEAMAGHAQTFTPNVSKITSVDPNNIIGSTWTFASLSSVPSITQEPADVRVFDTDPNAVFTVGFTSASAATAIWYKDGTAIIPDGVNVIVTTGATSSQLEIKTPQLSDEGKYYCIISNQVGTTDDKQTATRLLVIKKILAQFNFEQNLADSSGNAAPTGIVKTVSLADPNEMLATVVASPSYVTGIAGYAISLDGTQFIDLGVEGYPKAGPLDTLGDIRGAGYEKTGFGRGMEQGSILCWVKLSSIGAVYANANGSDDTHFGLSSGTTNNARMIVRGRNFDNSYQELGTAAGGLNMTDFSLQDGQWHMFAATWDDSGVRIYINGEQLASNLAGVPEKYTAWERANIIGASRTAGTRHILNSLLTGAIDSLKIYNYVVSGDAVATEYETLSGNAPCVNHSFAGNAYNFDNTASSYCKIDLADFAVFAENWLLNGLYGQ